ncbi:MAG TPA: hypothetical protein PL029_05935 [Bacteroidia bacterium]|nr:hypothetical protein [Bacteroidia bacterium]
MKIKIISIFISSGFITATCFFSCTKDKTPRPVESIPCDPNKVYFEKSIKPIINSNCAMSGCHDATTRQDGVNLSTYEGILEQVRPGRPQDSDLIETINDSDPNDRMPPLPRTALSQEQKDLLWKWVQQGADNIVCEENTGGCNPANVSFSADIQTILNTNCIGCHSGASLSGGVNLSAYGGAQTVAQSGKLVNATSQNGQSAPMPPNSKLPACDVQKIKVWVEEGIKNN